MNEEIKKMFVFMALDNPICHSIDYKQYYGELITKTARKHNLNSEYYDIKHLWEYWLEKCKKAMPNRPQDVNAQARKQLAYSVFEKFKEDEKIQSLFRELE